MCRRLRVELINVCCMQRSSTYASVLIKLYHHLQPTVCRTGFDPECICSSSTFLVPTLVIPIGVLGSMHSPGAATFTTIPII